MLSLVKAALAHVQFETIHPFLDGNGRVSRLRIALLLAADGLLREPLLYLSLYFKQHRRASYELLNRVRESGDWETWLEFFADAVISSATQAPSSARRLLDLSSADALHIEKLGRTAVSTLTVHRSLQRQPIATSSSLVSATRLTPATVNKSLAHLERIGVVTESNVGSYTATRSTPRFSMRQWSCRTEAITHNSVRLTRTQ